MSGTPNIVIIMTDQQRADLRAAEGFSLDTMPTLDALATQGVDFSRAYTTMPVCGPARVSLLTGRYPGAARVRTNHNIGDAYFEQDLVGVLRSRGYATAMCGKNHSHLKSSDVDYWAEFGHGGQRDGQEGVERSEEEERFDRYLTELKHLTDPNPAPFPPECQNPYRIVSKSIDWISSVKEKPFFLWLSIPEPHNPFQVSEPYFSLFPAESLPPLRSGKEDGARKGFKYRWMREQWEKAVPDFDRNITQTRSNYLGILRLIDDQLGRFLTFLDEAGLREDTIIVYTSDHGDFWGEYGLIRKGPELPEVLTRIPMVVTGPGISPRAEREEAHVSLADIMPTLCEAAGAPLPAGVQGRSLWPLLTGDGASAEGYPANAFSCAYVEHGFGGDYYDDSDELDLRVEGARNDGCYLDELNSWTQSGTAAMVRKGRYKLIYDMEETGQLYDLENDPVELENLFGEERLAAVQAELMGDLLAWNMRSRDPLPHPHRRYWFKNPHTGTLMAPR
jgi:arylsulfatase A-like enzyme